MENFVAIDVETANNHPSSICAIGAVKVVGGVIVERFYELVKPEPEYYFRHFTENIHRGLPHFRCDMAQTAPAYRPASVSRP